MLFIRIFIEEDINNSSLDRFKLIRDIVFMIRIFNNFRWLIFYKWIYKFSLVLINKFMEFGL